MFIMYLFFPSLCWCSMSGWRKVCWCSLTSAWAEDSSTWPWARLLLMFMPDLVSTVLADKVQHRNYKKVWTIPNFLNRFFLLILNICLNICVFALLSHVRFVSVKQCCSKREACPLFVPQLAGKLCTAFDVQQILCIPQRVQCHRYICLQVKTTNRTLSGGTLSANI